MWKRSPSTKKKGLHLKNMSLQIFSTKFGLCRSNTASFKKLTQEKVEFYRNQFDALEVLVAWNFWGEKSFLAWTIYASCISAATMIFLLPFVCKSKASSEWLILSPYSSINTGPVLILNTESNLTFTDNKQKPHKSYAILYDEALVWTTAFIDRLDWFNWLIWYIFYGCKFHEI